MRKLRYIPDSSQLVEITVRLSQGRFLFRPSRVFNRIFLGILGRAQAIYSMEIYAYAVLSGHYHLLLRPGNAKKMADFMEYLNTNLSKEVGRLYRFYGPKFQSRYRDIAVSHEPHIQISRLRYILSQGAKEGLVASPLDWPGAHCARPLTSGKRDVGTWFDRTRMRVAKMLGKKPKKQEVETDYEVVLSPIPCWRDCSMEEYQRRVEEIVRDIETETRARHREQGTRPLGVRKILRTDPFATPEQVAWSEAPPIHAGRKEIRRMYFEAYHTFLVAYRKAAELLEQGVTSAKFPEGCFPPALPYVRGPDF